MGEVPPVYEIYPPEDSSPPPKPGAAVPLAAAAVAVAVAALCMAVLGMLNAGSTASANRSQAAQIRALSAANARLSRELTAQGTELQQVTARLAAADPASDANLITCSDLRSMHLTTTGGGSVSSVPGNVNLSQNPVPLPAHCR